MTGQIPFVGRSVERERFAAAARSAASGHPWLVTIEGPPGAGKSALLRTCLDELPDGYVVERAFGDELAVDAPMGLLGQVVDVDDEPPFTVALRLVDHLAERQRDGAVAVLALEDLQWSDRPSLQALVTTLRRLDHDRVLVVATVREDAMPLDERWGRLRADPDRCRRIAVPPLTWQECSELAASSGTTLASDAAERLARHTAGNALYVRTLLDELTPSQLTESGPNLPVPRSLSSIVTAQVAALAGPAAAVCEALAVLGGRAPVATVEAIAGVPDVVEVVADPAVRSLIAATDGVGGVEVAFVHPLQEVAVYEDLAPSRRRALHLAAVGVVAPEAALRHRVLAADPADTEVERDLAEAAQAAKEAGRGALAARYLQWASDRATTVEARHHFALEASLVLIESGHLGAAHERCPTSAGAADRQLLDLVRGMLASGSGDAAGAQQLLRAATEGPDRAAAAKAHVQLGYLFTALSRGADAVEAVSPVPELVGPSADDAHVAGVLHAIGVSQQRGALAGLEDLAARFPDVRALPLPIEALVVGTRGMFEVYAGRPVAAEGSLRAFIDRAQRGLQIVHLPRVEALLALALIAKGAWDEAAVRARTAIDLAEDEGMVLVLAQAQAVAAMALAPGPTADAASDHAEQARRAADQAGTAEAEVWARLAEAAIAEVAGEPDRVIDALAPLESGPSDDQAPAFAALWLPKLTSASIDLGRLGDARRRAELLDTLAHRRNAELRVVALTVEGRLLARRDQRAALATFEEAEAAISPDTPVLDRFELQRHHGRLLLAMGRLDDARVRLHAAQKLVAPLGAGPLVERVRADLDDAGEALDLPTALPASTLTERERDVVALVRQGYTNREVAETLFVSVKAVEYHMGNIFSKLGIRSRRELRSGGR